MHRRMQSGAIYAIFAGAAAFLLGTLAACNMESAQNEVPASNIIVTVTAAASQEACPEDPIKVRFDPVKIAEVPVGSLMESRGFIEDVALEGKPTQAPDGSWVCTASKRTRPVAPGTWDVTVGFDSGNLDCNREIKEGTPHNVTIVEGQGCK